MTVDLRDAKDLVSQEARGLLTRLARLKPFSVSEPMVPAAAVAPAALRAIEAYLSGGRSSLRSQADSFLDWLQSPEGEASGCADVQRRFTLLRLRFNMVLAQFDIFADVMTQRSETNTGVWLAGLDAAAEDALSLPPALRDAPPVVCYLERGPGGAIRRARTRLPGGGDNPVAIIRIPRERMIGSGIAASLAHEAGHQAAALLDLTASVRPVLRALATRAGVSGGPWPLWDRWIGEVIPDFWSVGKVGVAATLGLMGVVSLPRAFVMRVRVDDPHPPPWVRVKLSCALGSQLYPHPQWNRLSAVWDLLYPDPTPGERGARVLRELSSTVPALARLLSEHRPEALSGVSLGEALASDECQPDALAELVGAEPRIARLLRAPPSTALAAVAQARMDKRVSPEQESGLVSGLLTEWALRKSLAPNSAIRN